MKKGKEKGQESVKRIPLTKSHQEITLQIYFSVQRPRMALSQGLEKKYVKHPNAFVTNHSSS
jgi:hypothetical protein